MGKWYMITWIWDEHHYYDQNDREWSESEAVFIPAGGSIARYILQKYKNLSESGDIYTREERGLFGFGVKCYLSNLTLLTSDGQKISGFKPKSIAHLCKW